jgi:ornithine cyclodeaminase
MILSLQFRIIIIYKYSFRELNTCSLTTIATFFNNKIGMIFINEDQIKTAASFNDWVDNIEQSFLLKRGIDFQMPVRTHIDFEENTLLLMPCVTKDYLSTKLVTLFPGNKKLGKPPLTGLVILNDGKTGEPLAIFDGPALTAMRTAAVGSVGVRHLSDKNVTTLGVIGLGIQGIHQALFACSQRNISKIFVYDLLSDNYKIFDESINKFYPDVQIFKSRNSSELCENTEVIITATNSEEPVLPEDKMLLKGKTVIGIGSYKPTMREFPNILYTLTDRIYVDTIDGLKESGDLLDPVKNGMLYENQFISIDKVIRGDDHPGKTRVFKSVGMALLDLVGAKLVYKAMNP